MWRVNKIGKEQVWYSEGEYKELEKYGYYYLDRYIDLKELVEKIKKECQELYDSNDKFYGLAQRILELIKEKENTDV